MKKIIRAIDNFLFLKFADFRGSNEFCDAVTIRKLKCFTCASKYDGSRLSAIEVAAKHLGMDK